MGLKFANGRQRRNAFLALENCYEQFESEKADQKKWFDWVFDKLDKLDKTTISHYKNIKKIYTTSVPEERFLKGIEYFKFDYRQIGDAFMVLPKKQEGEYAQMLKNTPEAKTLSPAEVLTQMPKRYVGVYKGTFIRPANNEVGEMILLISSSGEARFKSSLGEFYGVFANDTTLRTLVGKFKGKLEEGELYDYTFYIKGDCPLQIVYAGVSNIKDIQRRAGVVRTNTLMAGKDCNYDDKRLQQYYEAMGTPKSYKMENDKGVDQIMHTHLEDMLFAMGYVKRGSGEYVPNPLNLTESVAFFQNLNLIPTFPLGESSWEGNYYLYRLATTKTALIRRTVNISHDGRIKMLRQASNKQYELFGRVIVQEGGLLFLSVDTKRNKQGSVAHRGLYGFAVGDIEKENLKWTNGVSCITTLHHKLRGGLEVLIPVKNQSFEELTPCRIKVDKENGKLLGEFSKLEEVIFDYLVNHEIVTPTLEPNEVWKGEKKSPLQ